jgi:histidine triad (HIT) family protein
MDDKEGELNELYPFSDSCCMLFELPIRYAAGIHRVAKMVAMALKAVYSCDGVSTRQHNEPAGNQDVRHYHLHVTPRYEDDGFYATQREFMPVDQRAGHAEKLRGYLQQSESAKHPRPR